MLPDYILTKLNCWVDNYVLNPECTIVDSIKPDERDLTVSHVVFKTYPSEENKLLNINARLVKFKFPKINVAQISFKTKYNDINEFLEIALDEINSQLENHAIEFRMELADIDVSASKFSNTECLIKMNRSSKYFYGNLLITNGK